MRTKLYIFISLFVGALLMLSPEGLRAQGAPPADVPSGATAPAPAAATADAAPAPAPSRSRIDSDDIPLFDGINTDFAGSIPDTDVNRLMVQKAKEGALRPKYGFEDVFLVKGASAVLDIHKLGISKPHENLDFLLTAVGIVARSEKDPSGGQRVFAGTNLGSTQVLVYDRLGSILSGKRERGNLLKVYRITTTTEDLITVMQELKALIGNIEGLEIRIVGTQIVIDGAVLVPRDMRRVVVVAAKYQADKKPVVNLAEISPVSMKLLAEKMEEEIAGGKDRPKDIRVKVVNGRFFLEGAVDKQAERQTAELICKAYIAERYLIEDQKVQTPRPEKLGECVQLVKIRASQPVDPDPIISVRIDYVTLDRNYAKSFDFHWSPGFDATGNATYSSDLGKLTSSFVGMVTNLFPTLDSASKSGHARILKSATLLVRDGEDASKGGSAPPRSEISETLRIPIVVAGTGTTPGDLKFQEVKTSMAILAHSVPGSDKVNMDIVAQQSEIRSQEAQGATTLDNFIRTSLVVANGESAALGGLITERRNIDVERDPAGTKGAAGASSFNLFDVGRGHKFTDTKGQFIVFVTPEKIRSPSEGTEKLKRKFRLRK